MNLRKTQAYFNNNKKLNEEIVRVQSQNKKREKNKIG